VTDREQGRGPRRPAARSQRGTPATWGWWTSHKLRILGDYLQAFATASKSVDHRIYLDLFAGSPKNVSRETAEPILGSVHRALGAVPPFTRVCLFEMPDKAQRLQAEIRGAYPGRPGIRVYPGDCNMNISTALADLQEVSYAPTFAFIDQFDAEVQWPTLQRISRFRQGKTKAEMWILFATGFYPRGLNVHGGAMNARYGDEVTAMLGSEEWIPIAEARRRGVLDAASARAEWVNLMRWRLERTLGYRKSYSFTMKNTGGQDLYDMIFVTDHDAGDRIMRHLYDTAARRQPAMRLHALTLRRDKRLSEQGVEPLFPISPGMVEPAAPAQLYQPEPPREPYRLP
jgi:three-Cys-motif partner protein